MATDSSGMCSADRVKRLGVRLGRTLRFGNRRAMINFDIFNALNSGVVLQLNNNYAVWQTPQRIMDARLFKFSGLFDLMRHGFCPATKT